MNGVATELAVFKDARGLVDDRDRQVKAIEAAKAEGWTMQEIAAGLGISRNATYKILRGGQ